MRTSVLAVTFLLSLPAAGAQQPGITRFPLPAEITYPEGIAYDPRTRTIYTGSAETWALARLSPDTKQATLVTPGGQFPSEPFPALLGMKADQAGRLWLSGGRTGLMAVVDAKSGKEIRRFEVPTRDKSLINDVVVVESGAYYTDTFVPTLWRVPLHGDHVGELEPWLDLSGTPIQYEKGANLNGIAATADGRTLIVVQMNRGLLFRIDVGSRQVTPIDSGGEALNTADGLVLDGRTLYVVRQGEEEIVTIQLSEDLSKARVVNRFRDPAVLAWPATAALVGDELVVVNTQFNQRQKKQAQTPFTLVGIPLSRLSGK
jgi:sugar lactone lactonase YvrE